MSRAIPLTERPRRYTVEEYFALEEASDVRHEYLDGYIVDMAGGTDSHAVITANVSGTLLSLLRNTPCRPLGQELQVRYGKQQRFGYADCTVVCGPRQYDEADPRRRTLLNPTLIVEVASPSTELYDRREKFSYYREIESFREYVLVSQDSPLVEIFFKRPDGSWYFRSVANLDASVTLESLQVALPMAEIYRDVVFPEIIEGVVVPVE